VSPGSQSSQAARSITIQVWFTRNATITPTRRIRPPTLTTSRLSLTELVAGPSPAEVAAGIGTGISPDTTFDVIAITNGVATVTFPPAFYTGGRDAARLRQAQAVYTLTQFASVTRVALLSSQQPTGPPLGRQDFADLLPPILVAAPVVGERVTSPVNVSGTADVFEATVSVRILDASGHELATTFTTATCGTGCRGAYSVDVGYRLADEQPGVVEVYQVSQVDGSRVHVVSIPVILAASHRG
jgi:hypothetical protein